MKLEDILKRELDSIGDDHHSSNQENPIREDAFDVSDADKIKLNISDGYVRYEVDGYWNTKYISDYTCYQD